MPQTLTNDVQTPFPRISGELTGRFGRYEILRCLGRGGMGTVYLAVDTQLGREVALKIPHVADGDSLDVSARLRQEARAAALLSHTNICAVYDVGQEGGVHYLTMAYVEGKPLADRLRGKKPMDARQAVDLVRRLALALDYAHGHGVIHRDLKPSNIMMNARDEPIIMDFGLARQCDAKGPRLTMSGEALGTLAYMPPEQLRGKLSQIGPHSDVYSLGVLLFELLTGRPPFEGSAAQIIRKLLCEEPRAVADYQPGLSGSPLNAIVQKAMQKASDARFSSMAAFAEALANPSPTVALADIVAPPPPQSPKRRRRKNPEAKMLASLLWLYLASVSIVIGAMLFQVFRR